MKEVDKKLLGEAYEAVKKPRLVTLNKDLKLRSLRGTFLYLNRGEVVELLTIDKINPQKLLIQPLNGKGKPRTRFPYFITRSDIEEELPYT